MGEVMKGNGFLLRHARLSDLQGYFECQQDQKTKKGFMSVPKDISEAKKELKMKIADFRKKKPFGECFTIEVDGKFAGYVELVYLNQKHQEHTGEVGYCLHPNFRERGIMSKAVRLVTDYAFKKYKLKRMSGWCRTFNKASARTLEKAGYKLEGIMRKNKFKDGKYLDDMVWAVLR